jgi:hypothetical protein
VRGLLVQGVEVRPAPAEIGILIYADKPNGRLVPVS